MPHAVSFFVLFAAALSMPLTDALAQDTDKTKRVGYLVWSSYGARGQLEQALIDGMREKGYVEGKNLVVERRYVDRGTYDEVRAAARELASLKLDAIVSTCSPSTAAAKEATAKTNMPVVMALVSDPVGQHLIDSYRRPGGNVTGLSSQAEDTLPKMLQYLSDVVPAGAGIAVLYNTNNPVHPRLWQLAQEAAKERGSTLRRVDVSGRSDFAAAFDTIGRERSGGLLVLPDDNMTYNARAQLIELVQRQRIPAIFGAREFVDAGGLMSYGANMASNYRLTASVVDKVLKGAEPASTPVEQPTHFEFVVNVAAAKTLGVTIPQNLLLRADNIVREVPSSSAAPAAATSATSERKGGDGM
jgi:putative tryptophan/tyrosine transport system substrate-binding protein